ncbi:hypothetical protein [Methylobacterium sp. 37f]|uniref:hypothetical protein n=1 Tax=Methylobacterium sp. 37f TaxID=2817058 RepID=UPI001FFD6EF2|nr:hypothetical protein [Methylobacterium sp. 37f]MCK2055258.1 hypothetical protein [Methylobacterium sp. 37f]
MSEKILGILEPGQVLTIIQPRKGEEKFPKFEVLKKLKLLDEPPYIYATFIDNRGVSFYINRSYIHGGCIEAFFPKNIAMWQSYFAPTPSKNTGYALSKHYLKTFPKDFV